MHAWWMKKQGYKESIIKVTTANLTQLLKNGANLFDPDSVKECLARQEKWSLGYKLNVAETYATFVRKHGLKWEKPRFKPV